MYRYRYLFVSIFIFNSIFLTVEAALKNHKNIAKVIFVVGKSYRYVHKKNIPIAKGDLLNEGDYIVTGKHAVVLVRVENVDKTVTSMIKVNQNSKLKIRINRSVPMAHLSIGSVVVKVLSADKTNKKLKFKMQTRTAAIGVRGTEFFVYANNDAGQVTSLKEGSLEMNALGSTQPLQLAQGYSTTTNTKKQFTKPRSQEWEKDINWSTDPQEKDLAQPEGLFKSIEATWNEYKHEQEYRFEMYKKEQKKKLNIWNQNNDKLRNKMFGN